jgi:hypothetical protein
MPPRRWSFDSALWFAEPQTMNIDGILCLKRRFADRQVLDIPRVLLRYLTCANQYSEITQFAPEIKKNPPGGVAGRVA